VNREEARAVLRDQLGHYRTQNYQQLLALLNNSLEKEAVGPAGVNYYIEIQAVWDDEPKPDLRVIGAIDDGGLLRAMAPFSDSFIMRPDSSFVGE
jgi:hypothetical protein